MHDPIGQALRAAALRDRAGVSGRYAIFHGGHECGSERWVMSAEGDGLVIQGEQETMAPHPLPSRHEYRATLDAGGRLQSLDVIWSVAGKRLEATHRADGDQWRVRIEYGGQTREQHGDYPAVCEVEFPSQLFHFAILARRDFAEGGEHEFPVLRIGPPLMAVSPERMLMRCVAARTFMTPRGEVAAKRYVLSLPPREENEGYSFWADEDGLMLEAYEGVEPEATWMRLVEYHRGG